MAPYRTDLNLKTGNIDLTLPQNPDDLLKNPGQFWSEISDPRALKAGRRTFKNNRNEILIFDKGKPGEKGHQAVDHWHRPNPKATGKHDAFLDARRNPVPKGSDASHLYAPLPAFIPK